MEFLFQQRNDKDIQIEKSIFLQIAAKFLKLKFSVLKQKN